MPSLFALFCGLAKIVFFSGAKTVPEEDYASTGLGGRRADSKSFTKPEILVVNRCLIKQISFILIVSKVDAVDVHNFIIFSWFFQNHCQSGPDSPEALLNQPDGSDARLIEHPEKSGFRCLRYRYFNHHIFLLVCLS